MRCNLREQATQEGAVSQSPQEDPTGAVYVTVHSETGVIPNCLGAAQLGVHGTVPTAGLAGVRLIDVEHQCAALPGFPLLALLELVVAEGEHHAGGLAAYPAAGPLGHVLGLERR